MSRPSLATVSPGDRPSDERDDEVAIDVRSLSKRFMLSGSGSPSGAPRKPSLFGREKGSEFWALRDVSFKLNRGERLGVMGHNGAGKSVLLKILSRVLVPTAGEALIHGRVTSLLEVGTGFNPNLTGLQNIYQNAALHGLSREEIDRRIEAIITFSEIGRFIHEPIKTYSTGMRSRLGFAVAAHLDPDILMLDEVLSVGDAGFQRKSLERMEQLTEEKSRTLLFVSHSASAVRKFCTRCIWLSAGQIVMDGDVQEVCEAYEAQMNGVTSVYVAKPAVPARKQPSLKAQQSTGVLAPDEDGSPTCALVSAQVVDDAGNPVRSIKIDTACNIEMTFDVLKDRRRIEPALHFLNEKREMLFVVAFTDPRFPGALDKRGRFNCKARIPANLLNEGLHYVTIVLATADPLVRHETVEGAVSFSVYEVIGDATKTARGRYARSFPGGLRPRLDWITRAID